MNEGFDIEWSLASRSTWSRMPPDVQMGLKKHLQQLIPQYAHYYQQLLDKQKALGTSPVIHIPEWTIWVRFKMNYQEDEIGPILFIYEFEELTKRKVVVTTHRCHKFNAAAGGSKGEWKERITSGECDYLFKRGSEEPCSLKTGR